MFLEANAWRGYRRAEFPAESWAVEERFADFDSESLEAAWQSGPEMQLNAVTLAACLAPEGALA